MRLIISNWFFPFVTSRSDSNHVRHWFMRSNCHYSYPTTSFLFTKLVIKFTNMSSIQNSVASTTPRRSNTLQLAFLPQEGFCMRITRNNFILSFLFEECWCLHEMCICSLCVVKRTKIFNNIYVLLQAPAEKSFAHEINRNKLDWSRKKFTKKFKSLLCLKAKKKDKFEVGEENEREPTLERNHEMWNEV